MKQTTVLGAGEDDEDDLLWLNTERHAFPESIISQEWLNTVGKGQIGLKDRLRNGAKTALVSLSPKRTKELPKEKTSTPEANPPPRKRQGEGEAGNKKRWTHRRKKGDC